MVVGTPLYPKQKKTKEVVRPCATCNHDIEYDFKFAKDRLDPVVVAEKGDVTYSRYCAICTPGLDVIGAWVGDLMARQLENSKFGKNKGGCNTGQVFVHGNGSFTNNHAVIYAFNGGAFDWHLIMEYLMTTWDKKGFAIKISDDDAKSIEAAIEETKKAVQEGSVDDMNKAVDALTQASHKLAEAMYKAGAGATDAPSPDEPGAEQPSAESGAKDDDVVDAEFVDVDDKSKS